MLLPWTMDCRTKSAGTNPEFSDQRVKRAYTGALDFFEQLCYNLYSLTIKIKR